MNGLVGLYFSHGERVIVFSIVKPIYKKTGHTILHTTVRQKSIELNVSGQCKIRATVWLGEEEESG